MNPWKEQPVKPFVRFLAWVFVIVTTITYSIIIISGIVDVINGNDLKINLLSNDVGFVQIMSLLYFIVAPLYMSVLFGYVAFKGKAPNSWIPWKW